MNGYFKDLPFINKLRSVGAREILEQVACLPYMVNPSSITATVCIASNTLVVPSTGPEVSPELTRRCLETTTTTLFFWI